MLRKRILARYPLDPAEKSRKQRLWLLALTLAALSCAAVCLGILSLYFGSLYPVMTRLQSYFDKPLLAVLNIAPVVVLCLVLFALTDRAWLSFLIASVIVVALTYVNYYKVVIRGDVLVAEDLQYARDAAGVLDHYTIQLSDKFKNGIKVSLLGVAFLFLFCRGRVGKTRAGVRVRFLALAALIAVSLFGYRAYYVSEELYDSFQNYTLFNQWKDSEEYASHGFIYPFLHTLQDLQDDPPEGYSPTTAQALLDGGEDIPEGQEVNFLCIMLESFSDFSVYDSINFTQDAYADFHELAAGSVSGSLLTDTFGGGTVNTERSFLTGFTKLDDFNHAVWSYPRWFAEQGYLVEGSHPGHNWFYNRQNVDKNLGFSDYRFMENYYQQFTDEEYAYDDILMPQLAEQFRQAVTENDAPYFNFTVSYQGHSPYVSDSLVGGEYVSHDGLSDGAYYTVNNYLNNVADTGRRLKALSEELEALDEPVILVLFGDHKPTLGASNAYYAELGVSIDRATDEGFVNYYQTPYLIWANSAAKALLGEDFTGEGPTISPAFLMPEVFSLLGWKGSGFTQTATELMEVCPVVNKFGKYVSADGTVSDTVPAAAAQALENYEICQYYLRKTTAK